ncbi:FdhF/YdeP family oxidoreductase [Aureimonas leprariae]|uniref:FdhF/YdeP family oxidoreductase n=1 Tax=Plantimonas leprariae TaxID=2615207 RepID=A0A7V7PRR9_9HYPH|nr:FdhF/YdeP family oxidoreductase [Aureimonas leprariae]KAB0681442.1 FdhF/YdeP family oxidoreductase [Aureimonas leprariae]
MKRSEITDHPTVKPYTSPSGGWGSLKSVTEKTLAEGLSVETMQKMVAKQNKADGYMCVSCAWAKPAEPHLAEFCENGAKATAWEITRKRADRDFFARNKVADLRDWTDHELEKQGRLTTPMRYDKGLDQYVPVKWEDAFREIGMELAGLDPKSVVFYASGRAALETSHMWGLLARIYGNNNLPDSSNMCHESTSVGLPKSIGSPVGTVQLDDFDACDMMFFFGQNTGTNSPRLLHQIHDARLRGVPVVTFNPLPERGLMRFKDPQSPREMLSPDEGVKMSSDYFAIRPGGDIAAMAGMAKHVLHLDDAAKAAGSARVLDVDFIAEHGHGFAEFEAWLRAADWADIERISGIARADLERVGAQYARAEAVIGNYGMGLTQHRHGTQNVQMLVNLLLMRGNIGRRGAGISPIRGHSNVQGQRTVGITEKPELAPLDKFKEFYRFEPPREKGMNTVEACRGILDGTVKAFLALGGNFSRAVPETALIEPAWMKLRLSVQIATKLNRNHLLPGDVTFLLPCLGRIEEDTQRSGPQHVSMEDSTACIHGSIGWRKPASPELLSEPKIVAEIAKATVPDRSTVPWDEWVDDYSRIRDALARTYEDFHDFNERFLVPGGFHRDLPACRREWNTETKKANFLVPTGLDVNPDIEVDGKTILNLLTVRSNDQFNTTVYGYDDRLRGIKGTRMVILMNKDDMARMHLANDDRIDLRTHADDGIERRVEDYRVHEFAIPKGAVAGYYPELNPLLPLWHHDEKAHTPAAKSIPVEIIRRA